ncbi:ABC transporter ATP-binding protein [Engelhardtia mirabilis]|uniref:Putative ABC transporter ATP-binding protein n=1 Tax=Engelhardtia mirabilis TaxID=2528011 RepID=A0A518BIL6_9BACT|nr:putative ABC transporter ATP-binding protein [Planctomycetes bacterium Pla133]QDV01143.1 putative ABC transporter ATP-binding protein [Planctomycetes bacterium Pla86]
MTSLASESTAAGRFARHRTLLELTRGQRLRYGGAMLALWAGGLLTLGVPLVLVEPINRLAAGDVVPPRVLWLHGTAAVLITAGAGLLTYLRGRWAAQASERLVEGLRNRLHRKLHELPMSWHDRAETGDVVQRCTSDVETLRVFLAQQVVEIGHAALLLLTAAPILFLLDSTLAVTSIVVIPVILVFAVSFFGRIQKRFTEVDEAEGELTTAIQENLTGVRVVRAFGREEFELERFDACNDLFRARTERLLRLFAIYWSLSDVLCMTQMGLVLLHGVARVHAGLLTVGDLFAFIAFVGIFLWPVRHMGRVLADTGKALVSISRLEAVLDQPVEQDPELDQTLPATVRGELAFEDVTFAFDESTRAVDGISLTVPAGSSLALVGPPGSGKSTLVRLLGRFDDPDRGRITLDGIDLARLPRSWVRRQVGLAAQEPFLYSRTIAANLTYARRDAGADELERVARDAALHASIERFEKGYETLVGERGVTLSGGQRQRLSLARALLADRPILVLDDTLSAVDTRTEAEILAALERRRGRATTVVISHRLSSVVAADQIAVLDGGRVVQRGRHEELIGLDGPYQRLWQIQTALEDELDDDLQRTAGAEIAQGTPEGSVKP